MITVALSTTVAARLPRVWRALTDVSELALWQPGRIELLDPADGTPRPGLRTRWHCRIGGIPLILHEEFLEVVPLERISAALAQGPFRFQVTYSLSTNGDPNKTQLGMRLVAPNHMAVAGGVLDRFEIRRVAAALVADTLESLRTWCPSNASPPAHAPARQMRKRALPEQPHPLGA